MINPSKVWFITGCSTGLGRALAEAVLARGQRVIATARQVGSLDALAARFPETCRTLALDVTDGALVKTVIPAAAALFGRLDVLVNNAGRGLVGALEECSEEQVWRNFNTNLFGPLRVIRAALPVLRAQRRGHLVSISAAAAIGNYAGFAVYGGAKCALEGVSEALALELRPLGIKVTLVQPGPFRTDFIRRSLEFGEGSIADYAASSGKFRAFLEKADGAQPGDPRRAAEAIIAATEAEKPPLRLVLGKYATAKVARKLDATRAELEAWQAVGRETDFAE